MSYGITEQGFIVKPYSEILSDMQEKARELLGDDIDLSEYSPDGLRLALMAWAVSQQWDLAEDVYYAMWLSTAEGASLDRVVKLGFASRQPSAYATVPLEFAGEAGSEVPVGTQAETAQAVVFETLAAGVIGEGGTVLITALCTVAGVDGIVAEGMINSIKTPLNGVDSVTNPSASTGGRPIEEDPELRTRYSQMPFSTGSSTEAIYAALSNLAGVISVMVFENTSNATDENEIPPKCIEAVVHGGDDDEIAAALFDKKAGGIDLYGSTEVMLVDSQGIERTIRFSRPENVDVYVIYDIVTSAEWDEDNSTLVKRRAIEYIGGVDDLLNEYEGVGISKTVFAWKLRAVQLGISGISDITVKIGITPGPTASNNLPFLPRQRARTDSAKITVNVS